MARPEITGRRIIGYKDLPDKGITWSRQWIGELIKEGKFPASIQMGEATVGFVEGEVDDYIDQRIRERDLKLAAKAAALAKHDQPAVCDQSAEPAIRPKDRRRKSEVRSRKREKNAA